MGFNKTVTLTIGEYRTEIKTMIVDDNIFEHLHEVYDVWMELVEQPLSDMIHIPGGLDKSIIAIDDNESLFFIRLSC